MLDVIVGLLDLLNDRFSSLPIKKSTYSRQLSINDMIDMSIYAIHESMVFDYLHE